MICPKCGASYEGETCPECSSTAQPEAAEPITEPAEPVPEPAAEPAPESAEEPAPTEPTSEAAAPAPEPVPEKTPMDILLIALAVLGGLLLAMIAAMMLTDRMPEWAGSSTAPEDAAVFHLPDYLIEEKKSAPSHKGIYYEGQYIVGEDIPAGTYEVVASSLNAKDYFYVGLYEDKKKDFSDLIWEGYKQLHCPVTVQDNQLLVIEDAVLYSLEVYEQRYDPYADPGVYRVGTDLEPGQYQVVPINTSGVATCVVYSAEIPDDRHAESYSYLYPDTPDCILNLREGQSLELIDCVVTDYYG